jgi:hypothetical protein
MTKKELVRIIREVVKREIKNVLNEQYGSQPVKKNKIKKPLTKNPLINEALSATEEYDTVASLTSADVGGFRSKFAQMQNMEGAGGPINMIPPELQHQVESGSEVEKALTRDYSGVVKAWKKKK